MRRLLIAASFLLAGQAKAVDYVKCDAIQKTYSRVVAQQQEAGKAAYEARQQELCGFDYGCRVKQENGTMSNHAKAYESRKSAEMQFDDKIQKIKADYIKEGCP